MSPSQPSPVPPRIPTGPELFDVFMRDIEPELTERGMKDAEKKYAEESPGNKAARIKRYDAAFEKCRQACDAYMKTLDIDIDRYRHGAFTKAESDDRAHDESVADRIEQFFRRAA